MEALKISANKRYFIKENGKPFIWIADTVWTMPQRIKWDDVDYYMKKRKSQGFTVLQIVALNPERDVEMRSPDGIKALNGDDLSRLNEGYFQYLDWILNLAAEYGFYVLLLPVWGQLVVGDNWMGKAFEKTVTEKNAYDYGAWIGQRYKNHKHIIWCLGGDRQPVHKGADYRMVWRRMAEGLARGVLGQELKYNENREAWEKLLITYHACHEMETGECSTMSYWSDEEQWIQFIMLQSGHGTSPKNFELVKKEYNRENTMPVWDGEPAYEMMPTTWPVIKEFHGSWMVRKRAYWSLFAGSFGHTYGHASIWCAISERERNRMTPMTWYEALDSEGAAQIKILRDFLESIPMMECIPAQKLVHQEDESLNRYIQVTMEKNKDFLCAYLPMGGSCRLKAAEIKAEILYAWWFNPRDGKCYDSNLRETEKAEEIPINTGDITITAPEFGEEKDWVLLLFTRQQGVPVISGEYGELAEKTAEQKVFEW